MKISKMAFVAGAVAATFAGMVLAACSSDDSSGTTPTPDASSPGADTGAVTMPAMDSGTTTPPGMDSGTTTPPGMDSGSTGTDAGCGTSPTLHTTDAGSIFCGYNDAGSFACGVGTQCCLGGKVGSSFDPEDCVSFGATCDNPAPTDAGGGGLPIQCGQISDCTANGITGAACCLQGTAAPATVPGCTYAKATNGTGVVCEASDAGGGVPACAAGEVQICSSDSDCPTGQTCTPMKWKLYQMGYCK